MSTKIEMKWIFSKNRKFGHITTVLFFQILNARLEEFILQKLKLENEFAPNFVALPLQFGSYASMLRSVTQIYAYTDPLFYISRSPEWHVGRQYNIRVGASANEIP